MAPILPQYRVPTSVLRMSVEEGFLVSEYVVAGSRCYKGAQHGLFRYIPIVRAVQEQSTPMESASLKSHSLSYTSSRSTSHSHSLHDAQHHGDSTSHGHAQAPSRSRGHILERTALARLAADEQYMHRRRIHVQNFGSSWLRPLGVPKTLHQMREEKRELEEHQEALRREQLAQEYAEAAAGGDDDAEEGLMDDVQLDGAQDLDDEIPDADTAGGLFAMDADSDDDEGEEEDEDRGVQDVDDAEDESELDDEALREERQNDLMAARMRMTDDAFREALVRGDPDGDDMYGGEEELQAENQGHMLDEEDFAHDGDDDHMNDGLVDMDANLDDDIPEAESGLYEHTDSEADLSSIQEETRHDYDYDDDDDDDDDEEQDDFDFAPRTAVPGSPQSPTLRGRRMSAGLRESMDLSNMLSQDESSIMQSSPAQRRSR
ncbi:hypothetical protein E4U42_003800 [Claviceps africana]|uniref:Replicase polyprotein 1a n=1 Tax=Claviceps africana TaxID=83212 RepID=A0A8K0J6A3_9HYPO|nr:hypothetical protein E4U42_003800 [Claviceps africana]